MTQGVDKPRIARAVREILLAIGADPDSSELAATPARVADTYAEFFAGVDADPLPLLADALPAETRGAGELIAVGEIAFRSVCEHHLLPFKGTAGIVYAPGEKLAGLSALPRVVELLAARPQMQERLGEQIAEAISEGLGAAGVLVLLTAQHGCVSDRGVRAAHAVARTLAVRGTLQAAEMQAVALQMLAERSAQ